MEKPKEITINNKISYIPACEGPLSADIGIIREGELIFLYDVGCGPVSLSAIPEGVTDIVLSHFHQDHTGNLTEVRAEHIYGGKETCKHITGGTLVEKETEFGNLRIFPLPSTHAAGSLGLEVDGSYAFVGDALYAKSQKGDYVYNAQLLKEEIAVLKSLKAEYLLVSHYKGLLRKKSDVLKELETIYGMREKNNPFISLRLDRERES